jgi:hypothetical protein
MRERGSLGAGLTGDEDEDEDAETGEKVGNTL